MLNIQDIHDIVALGEGYYAEFKKSPPAKVREIASEVCALANASGGNILIGVDDQNKIIGCSIENAKRSAIQNAINEVNPHIHCPFYKVSYGDLDIWVIEVPSGSQKPYTYSGAIYVRQGPNSQKITSVERMRDFFQQSDRIYFDETPCKEFDPKIHLDDQYFSDFRQSAGLSSSVEQNQIIDNLKLTGSDGAFKNGGVLFFAAKPEHFFEKAVIRCVAFEGTTKTQIIDDKIFGGPLMRQYQQALQWLRNKLDVRYVIEGTGPRKEHWEIPDIALKEAIINALSHRDYYDKGARIIIELFSDRLEISNPGGLVSVINEQEFGKRSHSRNPLIFGLFERINMVEQVGSGIGRIRSAMKKQGLPAPVFGLEGMFSVIFSRPAREKTRGKTRGKTREKTREKTKEKTKEAIVRLIQENDAITTAELATAIGITEKGVEYQLNKLKKTKVIKREGPPRGGRWIVLKS